MRLALICLLALLGALAGCSGLTPEQRRESATQVAMDAGWQSLTLNGGSFVLAGFAPASLRRAETLHIYIEGDGLAWINSSTPSFDPTPVNPLGLQLAIQDTSKQAVYLARPCQYVADPNCRSKYWTSHRFAPELIAATQIAIDQLKRRFQSRRIVLVGFSGGGAVAALVAAGRKDVAALLTVAGNLDHDAWTKREMISPLNGSQNPADVWQELLAVPQLHFVGAADKVVHRDVAESFRARFPAGQQPELRIIPGFDHHCCWVREWPILLGQGLAKAKGNRVNE